MEDKIQILRNWLEQNGADLQSVGVKDFGFPTGRGLCANRDIQKDELFITIPYKCQINRFNLKEIWPEVTIPSFNEGDVDRDNLNAITYLYLAVNKTNPNCFHYPYIAILPETYDCPLGYLSDEIEIISYY